MRLLLTLSEEMAGKVETERKRLTLKNKQQAILSLLAHTLSEQA